MELSKKIIHKVSKLSDDGDNLLEQGNQKKALIKYFEALKLIPEPKFNWNISRYLYISIGDAYYLCKNYNEALLYMQNALKCPYGVDDAFINLRIGQCLYEQDNFEAAKKYLFQV